jgi:hypothetical protein
MKADDLVKRLWAWEPIGRQRWFTHCDVCKRSRIVARYHEVYYDATPDDESGWQWACTRCLADVLGDIAEFWLATQNRGPRWDDEDVRPVCLDAGLLWAALAKIRDEEGKVCPDFELCTHDACRSSYSAWAIADAALKGELLE